MINFAKQSEAVRQEGFNIAAPLIGLSEGIIEKDFYVVLMLEILFHHTKYGKHFAFKGGTSLSKGYNIIKRFSEDIDLVMDWNLLGLSDGEVWQNRSNRQQQIFNEKVNIKAEQWLERHLLPELVSSLQNLGILDFHLFIHHEDKQTVVIEYPRHYQMSGVLSEIRLEIGPLAAWTPIQIIPITSYLAETLPIVFSQENTFIPTVEAKRTFWEKATILHKEAHRRVNQTPKRYSRHYYDLYMLSQTEVKLQALGDLELLQRVVDFKKKFYMDNSSHYDDAVPTTLALMPKEEQLENLGKDYQTMQIMMFEKAPSFETILSGLSDLEKEIKLLKS
jgi:predicted nucleotidyltransferase component of viral defense system